MKLHAFVAMPFGLKKDSQGNDIDFNRVYGDLIKPALEAAGLVVFRADQEKRAGDIRTDMFQKLLIADLVLADLTLNNPNVWYELGVRHALRACGGDLLFTEACQQRGVKVHWLQPFREPEFIQKSVVQSDELWRQRYLDAKTKLAAPIRSAPDELGEPPAYAERGYAYQRCNLWLLYTALAYGVDKVRFVCLWNGGGGDGPGGTEHMYNEVKHRTGQVTWLDTRTLW